jgi:D-aminopeptidase
VTATAPPIANRKSRSSGRPRLSDLSLLGLRRRVERLLEPWQRGDGPGVTIGVVLGDALVVHANAGVASLELAVPISPASTFRIASVSKQFTCAAVLLLAAEGKLAVEDDVRDYLPALPDLGQRITLDHLMHNSSGIRDMLELMRLGGVDLGQPCRPEDLYDAICRQRGLNFPPGSRYLYSNSNFLLLGRIVEQVAGEAFAAFLERRIFTPLGMTATRHVTRTTEVVPGLASGYFPDGSGGWTRALHNFPLHGEGGLVSSVEDLALWHGNFTSCQVGGPALIEALGSLSHFTGGMVNTYARGLRIKQHRGVRTVGHDGLWPGFKTSFVRVPEHAAAVICISNDATSDPHALAFQVVDMLVEGKPGVHRVPAMPAGDVLARLPGRYLDRATGATVDLAIDRAGQLTASTNGVAFTTVAAADGRLITSRGSADFAMAPAADGDALEVERDAGVCATLVRIAPGGRLPADLAGRYRNEDTAATWTISATDDGAELRVVGPLLAAEPWRIEPIEGDCIRIYTPLTLYNAWLDTRVLRDAVGRITGLHVDGGRVKRLVFARLD